MNDKTDFILYAERLNRYIELEKFSNVDKNLSIPCRVGDDTSCSVSKSVSQQVVEVGKTEGVDDVPFRVNGGIQDKRTVIPLRRFNSEKSAA